MAKLSTLHHGFDYQPVSSRWSGWNGARHSINAGRLQTTLPASTSAYYTLISVETFDLTESYVFCELVQRTNQDQNSTETIFGTQIDSSNAIRFLVSGTQLINRETVGGSSNEAGNVTYNSSTHKWLRIRAAGTTIYWDTSADRQTWTNRRSKTTTLDLTAMKVEFSAGAWSTANTNPGSAIWDNLNLPSPAAFQFGG